MGGHLRIGPSSALVWALFVLTTVLAMDALAGETARFRFEPGAGGETRRSFRFPLAPGQSTTDSVTVTNKTREQVRMRVYAADAVKQADGAIAVAPFGSPPRGVGSWIVVSQGEVTIGPGQKQTIRFELRRPMQAEPPGLAALVAEEVPAMGGRQDVEVVTRVALLVRVSEPSEGDAILVEGVEIRPARSIVPSSAELMVTVTNRTPDQVVGSVSFTVVTITGARFDVDEVKVSLGPGQRERVKAVWEPLPRMGALARAEAAVALSGHRVRARGPLTPVVAVWLMLVVLTVELYLGLRRLLARSPGTIP